MEGARTNLAMRSILLVPPGTADAILNHFLNGSGRGFDAVGLRRHRAFHAGNAHTGVFAQELLSRRRQAQFRSALKADVAVARPRHMKLRLIRADGHQHAFLWLAHGNIVPATRIPYSS